MISTIMETVDRIAELNNKNEILLVNSEYQGTDCLTFCFWEKEELFCLGLEGVANVPDH